MFTDALASFLMLFSVGTGQVATDNQSCTPPFYNCFSVGLVNKQGDPLKADAPYSDAAVSAVDVANGVGAPAMEE